jgi:transcriptional regulator with XRE-family HTH domain
MSATIANRLKKVMAQQHISSMELAKRAGLKPSFVYDILNGKSANPSSVKLVKIAETLGIDLYYLLGKEESHTTLGAFQAPSDSEFVAISTFIQDVLSKDFSKNEKPFLEKQANPYFFRKSWIRDRIQSSPEHLKMLFVRSDDMEPTLNQGDIVLVDTSKKNPTPAGLFAIYDGIGITIKRLEFISQTVPPCVHVISDNTKYSHYERPVNDMLIIGRVVWFSREL